MKIKKGDELSNISPFVPLTIPISNFFYQNLKEIYSLKELLYNKGIGSWDTSSVIYMGSMFSGATAFNQDLSGWCVSKIVSEPTGFSTNSALANANKPVWGKEFTVALTSGSESQTVTANNAITSIVHTVTPICSGNLSSSNSGLPSGVISDFNSNVNTISGTPTQTGTYNYTITINGPSTSSAITGTITVQ